jgi:hypothetical protein
MSQQGDGPARGLSRRQMARAIGRGLALAGLVLGTGFLLRRGSPPADCERSDPCALCALRTGCDLPRTRQAARPEDQRP